MNLKTLATKEHPMRISSTPTFGQCAGFYICRTQEIEEDRQAATNGTTVGRAVELWHKGDSPEVSVQRAVAENPTCQESKVRGWFDGYRMDPRNNQNSEHLDYGAVVPELQEEEVVLEIDGCYFVGHIDQIRKYRDEFYLWDLKASSFGGGVLLSNYAAQLCFYTVACKKTWNIPMVPGGIIRMTSYGPRAKVDAFYPANWTYDDCMMIVKDTVQMIKDVRRGKFQLRPGHQCSYCPGGGLGTCRKMVEQIITGRCPVCGENAKKGRVTCCKPECIAGIRRSL